MDLRRIPPAMLVALGLEGCGEQVSTCLSMMIPTSEDEGTSGSTGDDATESDVGPCLGQLPTTDTGIDGTGTDTGSSSGSDTSGTDETSTGTESGTDDGAETSTSVCLAPPPDGDVPPDGEALVEAAPARGIGWQAAFSRVAGKLPADVAARLGTKRGEGR